MFHGKSFIAELRRYFYNNIIYIICVGNRFMRCSLSLIILKGFQNSGRSSTRTECAFSKLREPDQDLVTILKSCNGRPSN